MRWTTAGGPDELRILRGRVEGHPTGPVRHRAEQPEPAGHSGLGPLSDHHRATNGCPRRRGHRCADVSREIDCGQTQANKPLLDSRTVRQGIPKAGGSPGRNAGVIGLSKPSMYLTISCRALGWPWAANRPSADEVVALGGASPSGSANRDAHSCYQAWWSWRCAVDEVPDTMLGPPSRPHSPAFVIPPTTGGSWRGVHAPRCGRVASGVEQVGGARSASRSRSCVRAVWMMWLEESEWS